MQRPGDPVRAVVTSYPGSIQTQGTVARVERHYSGIFTKDL